MNGKPFASTTPLSLFGYRPALGNFYVWGTTGLDSAYLELFDTAPPAPTPLPIDPCTVPGTCASNVLFLPGIEGSRLYEGEGEHCTGTAGEKLWEPLGDSIIQILRGAGDDKVENLFLDQTGSSLCSSVYTKIDDIIDSVGSSNIYRSFIDEMNGLKTDGTINDWKPIAYDWRLSIDDLLGNGAERGGKIFYAEATSTPYIEQSLRALAASSKTGKVSIVAHSNGGLLAKALLNKLDSEAATLVDKVIMVGAPQSGAPVDVGVLLFGHDQGISSYGIPILHSDTARSLAQNSPMAYHLLPSQSYFDSVTEDADHPVARFAGDGYATELAAYDNAIGTADELTDFLLAREGGREKPDASDVKSAEILNASLIDYGNSKHATLDSWTPPTGIEVSQIAGWGADTVAGIDFYTPPSVSVSSSLEPMRLYKPIFTEDGDGTVPVPSALMMSTSTENVKRYWLNLDSYFRSTSIKREHKDLFEIPSLEDFVKDILKNSTSTLPSYISSSQPAPIADSKKLTFFLHSPLTLELTDSSGNVTGLAEDGSMTQDIPDSTYGEFGEVKYIIVPQGSEYQLTMHGQESGTFSLDIQESLSGVVTASSTIANVPTTASTLASLTITNGIDTSSPLTVDKNGDGNIITITPKVGETVEYVEPRRSHWGPTPIVIGSTASDQEPIATITSTSSMQTVETIATTTESFATSTPEVATSTEIVQVEKKEYVPIAKGQKTILPPKTNEVKMNIPQTASVYEASQQPVLKKLGETVYNSLHRLWRGFKVMLLIKK